MLDINVKGAICFILVASTFLVILFFFMSSWFVWLLIIFFCIGGTQVHNFIIFLYFCIAETFKLLPPNCSEIGDEEYTIQEMFEFDVRIGDGD